MSFDLDDAEDAISDLERDVAELSRRLEKVEQMIFGVNRRLDAMVREKDD